MLVVFNIFASLIIDVFLAQYEVHTGSKEAVDESTASMEIDATLQADNDNTDEFKVMTSFVGSDDIFKKMFEDELEEQSPAQVLAERAADEVLNKGQEGGRLLRQKTAPPGPTDPLLSYQPQNLAFLLMSWSSI